MLFSGVHVIKIPRQGAFTSGGLIERGSSGLGVFDCVGQGNDISELMHPRCTKAMTTLYQCFPHDGRSWSALVPEWLSV